MKSEQIVFPQFPVNIFAVTCYYYYYYYYYDPSFCLILILNHMFIWNRFILILCGLNLLLLLFSIINLSLCSAARQISGFR